MDDRIYELHQVHINPRDGLMFATSFDTYATLAEAKAAGKKELKDRLYQITETRVLFQNPALKERLAEGA